MAQLGEKPSRRQPRGRPDIEIWRRHAMRSQADYHELESFEDFYPQRRSVRAEISSADAPVQRKTRSKSISSRSSKKHIPSPTRPKHSPFRKRFPSPKPPLDRSLVPLPSPEILPQLTSPYSELDGGSTPAGYLQNPRNHTSSPPQYEDESDASVKVTRPKPFSRIHVKQILLPRGGEHPSSHSPPTPSSTEENIEPKSPSIRLKSAIKSVPLSTRSSSPIDEDSDNAIGHEIFGEVRYGETGSDIDDSQSSASQYTSQMPLSPYRPSSLNLSGSTLRPTFSQSKSGVLGDKFYQYKELQDPMEIRLVRILPARMSTIKCEIEHVSLEAPPPYIAISYAWGDAAQTGRIDLDGISIPIAISLYSALEALREKKDPVRVWVDALCIDQQHGDERTLQVKLMTNIYTKAKSVAIWLGPEADDSDLAVAFIRQVAANADSPEYVSSLISSINTKPALAAVVALFERSYWRRLWVVQEVYNARVVMVYCGSTKSPWIEYKKASEVFVRHRAEIDREFHGRSSYGTSSNQFTYSQVLVYQGPSSLPDLGSLATLGKESFLEAMCVCRRKLSTDPRDKVFGILGVLPLEIRAEFPVDYNQSLKDVYINAVDYLLHTTDRLDVICESIHFPLHTNAANLPTWVPDWSHIPETASLGRMCEFSAAGTTDAEYKLIDGRLKLQVSAIHLDTISYHGIAVGTLCTLADYLMAFLHWRALLRDSHIEPGVGYPDIEEAFCRTLCLDQVPLKWNNPQDWLSVCYHVFSSLIRDRLPSLPLNNQLKRFAAKNVDIKLEDRRQFLQEHFGGRMMGRCFCFTKEGCIGMGTGFMTPGDLVVVPLGCSTPILLRPEGGRGEYRFVGDVYIHGYMNGEAVDQWKEGKKLLRKYIIH